MLELRQAHFAPHRNISLLPSPCLPRGESREIPLFPELWPYLEECFDLAEPGTEYVITRYRDTNANLRTQLLRIIQRAGLQRWPKLFQNLRSTRETELAEDFPMHVGCQWIGNSQPTWCYVLVLLTEILSFS